MQSCKNTVLKMNEFKKMFIEVNLFSKFHKVKSLLMFMN